MFAVPCSAIIKLQNQNRMNYTTIKQGTFLSRAFLFIPQDPPTNFAHNNKISSAITECGLYKVTFDQLVIVL